jgi:hypothetical protein
LRLASDFSWLFFAVAASVCLERGPDIMPNIHKDSWSKRKFQQFYSVVELGQLDVLRFAAPRMGGLVGQRWGLKRQPPGSAPPY